MSCVCRSPSPSTAPIAFARLALTLALALARAAAGQPFGLESRAPVGPFLDQALPPDQPAPGLFAVVPAFPGLTFENPVGLVPEPGSDRLCVHTREGRIYAFRNDPATVEAELFLDLSPRTQAWDDCGLLGMAFHLEYGRPGSTNRGYVYVYYQYSPAPLPGPLRPPEKTASYNRLSRFTVPDGARVADPASELILMDLYDRSVWHNGGAMFFHPEDGFLYLSLGDEGGVDAEYGNAQRLDRGLFAGVIRIDVNQDAGKSHPIRRQPVSGGGGASRTAHYAIPNDNPFQDPAGGLLEEFWCLGLRSPHRMTLDPVTGTLWLGDVGQGAREEVNVIVKGGNYQWAYKEGNLDGPFPRPAKPLAVDVPPLFEYPHTQGQSWQDGDNCVIGGYVYRGTEHAAELGGKYVFGDNGSGRIWVLSLGAHGAVSVELIASMPPGFNYSGLSSFGIDHHHELYLCQMGPAGRILKLQRPVPSRTPPPLLSQTGAFEDLRALRPARELIPYEVSSPLWSDGAVKTRWMALPNDGAPYASGERLTFSAGSGWSFPAGTVFVKHFELPLGGAEPGRRRRLETRFLVRDPQGGVYGITYKWRADESDADLLTGAVTEAVADGQTWYYPSPRDCLVCHTPAAGHVLGVKTSQLNRSFHYTESGQTDNQLRTWDHLGLFDPPLLEEQLGTLSRLVPLTDQRMPLERRARSYLEANCAHCHRPGGVRANFDARYETPLARQGIVNGPVHDRLGIEGARVVSPGDPARSMMLHRLGVVGEHQMPPLARNVVDEAAVGVLTAWVASLPPAETARGLRGEYFNGFDLTGPAVIRIDSAVHFDWGQGGPHPSLGVDAFSVRWSGEIEAPASGTYSFYTLSDDGVRLWLDDRLVIDNWTSHAPTENRGTVELVAGRKHPLRVEYFEDGGGALLRLSWSGPGLPKQIVGSERLSAARDPVFPLPAPVLDVGPSGDGGVRIVIDADRAADYTLEASANLRDWIELGRFPSRTGWIEFTDPDATRQPHRYYRAQGRE